jgi:hypothetical protein
MVIFEYEMDTGTFVADLLFTQMAHEAVSTAYHGDY